jgi:hypothetical protein
MSIVESSTRQEGRDRQGGQDGSIDRKESIRLLSQYPVCPPVLPWILARIYRYAATSTLIDRGFASSRSGSRTVRTPCLYSAETLAGSTVCGSENERLNVP